MPHWLMRPEEGVLAKAIGKCLQGEGGAGVSNEKQEERKEERKAHG